ncbi:alpha/beta hydrolase [Nocardioides yefusunii]|uniref:Alpha/beta hydrolase n=1 Tax=Nocardioides yefusunii TaxID=2500546 RepID=A0ABW1R1F9_9ACTN|nr:alpha/beta hydrolase [Nocardioides yefusunii]
MKKATTRIVALVAVLALVLGTIATALVVLWPSGEETPETLKPIPVPSIEQTDDLTPFMEQEIQFVPCSTSNDDLECAWLAVPLDYADPAGTVINLAVNRMASRDPEKRIGTLVVNPGGPGGSGTEMAGSVDAVLGRTLASAFDVVGFDPRGVMKSAALDCYSDADLNAYVDAPTPTTAAEIAAVDVEAKKLAAACLANSGELARHVSTIEAVKDMDVLRAALGQEKLDFYGASYGTKLGATYAELFPARVGKFVLDGGMDPTLELLDLSLGQAKGFEIALRSYVKSCQTKSDCPLTGDVDAGVQQVRDLLDSIEKGELKAGDEVLTSGDAFYGIVTPLYRESYWTFLTQVLTLALDGDGSMLLYLADQYLGRDGESFLNNSLEASAVINCLDDPTYVTADEVKDYLPRFEKASPTFGRVLAWGLTSCQGFGFPKPEKLEIDGAGAAPILVTATTRDPATPYAWGVALAEQLESGVLISRDGDGHIAYNSGNTCVDEAVDAYFLDGKVPTDTVTC